MEAGHSLLGGVGASRDAAGVWLKGAGGGSEESKEKMALELSPLPSRHIPTGFLCMDREQWECDLGCSAPVREKRAVYPYLEVLPTHIFGRTRVDLRSPLQASDVWGMVSFLRSYVPRIGYAPSGKLDGGRFSCLFYEGCLSVFPGNQWAFVGSHDFLEPVPSVWYEEEGQEDLRQIVLHRASHHLSVNGEDDELWRRDEYCIPGSRNFILSHIYKLRTIKGDYEPPIHPLVQQSRAMLSLFAKPEEEYLVPIPEDEEEDKEDDRNADLFLSFTDIVSKQSQQ